MNTLSFLIKLVGSYNVYVIQQKTTSATANETVTTEVVKESSFYNLEDALKKLELLGVKRSEVKVTMEMLEKYDHNYASFGINRGLVLTNYVGDLS